MVVVMAVVRLAVIVSKNVTLALLFNNRLDG